MNPAPPVSSTVPCPCAGCVKSPTVRGPWARSRASCRARNQGSNLTRGGGGPVSEAGFLGTPAPGKPSGQEIPGPGSCRSRRSGAAASAGAQASLSTDRQELACSPPTSRSTGRSEASTGVPVARASSTGRPKPSYRNGRATAAAAASSRRSRLSVRNPVRTTSSPARGVSPRRRTCDHQPRSGAGRAPAQCLQQGRQPLARLHGTDEEHEGRPPRIPASSWPFSGGGVNQSSSTPSGVTTTRRARRQTRRGFPGKVSDGVSVIAASRTPRGTRSR